MSPAVGAGRQITIRSISCRGVKSYVPFQTPPLYAAVSLAGRREKTPADPNGSENPEWDHAIRFDLGLDADAQLLQFEVKAQVPLLGNKRVGTAAVPVADLGAPDGAPRYASYQVLAPDGKPNGTLSLYYAISSLPPPANPTFPVTTSFLRQSSYPPPPPPPASTPLYPHLPASDFVLPSCCPPPLSSPAPPPPPNYHPPPPPLSSSAYPALPNPPPYSSYPPPPPPAPAPALMPEPSLAYPALAYSAPSSVPALHYPAISRFPLETRPSEGRAPLGAAGYPPPGTGYPEEAARTPYYPPPGTRYP